jgi:hypothetical protein
LRKGLCLRLILFWEDRIYILSRIVFMPF